MSQASAAGSRCVVTVPAYKPQPDPLERAMVRRNVEMLPGVAGAWVLPKSLDSGPYRELAPDYAVERFDDPYFSGIPGYNRLMLGAEFYERWKGFDYLLICQTDVLLLKPNLHKFVEAGFDYLGAPWPRGFRVPRFYFPGSGRIMERAPWLIPHDTPRVGNGGLSLRRLEAFRRLIARDRVRRALWRMDEDIYYGTRSCDPRSGFRAGPEALAGAFARETDLGEWALDPARRPFGLHKPQAYAPGVLAALLEEFGFPEAAGYVRSKWDVT